MLVTVLLTLLIVGVVLYLVTLIPMDATIAQVIRVVVILAAILYVLQAFGLVGGPRLIG